MWRAARVLRVRSWPKRPSIRKLEPCRHEDSASSFLVGPAPDSRILGSVDRETPRCQRQALSVLFGPPAKESGSVIGPRRTSFRTLRRRNRTQSLSCCSYWTASERLPATQYHTSSGRLPAVDFVFPSQCSRIRRRKSRVWPTYIRGLPSSFRI